MASNKTGEKSKKLVECTVCRAPDSASYHFLGLVCQCCSSFFRRTVSLKCNYQCSRGKKCEVYYSLRMVCKSCRFQKCLDANMDVRCVQQPRGKYVVKSDTPPNNYKEANVDSASNSSFDPINKAPQFRVKKKLSDEEYMQAFIEMERISEKRKQIILGSNPLSALTSSAISRYEVNKELRAFTFKEFNTNVRCITLLTFDYLISMPYYEEFSEEDKFTIFRYGFFSFCLLDNSFLTMKNKFHEKGLFICANGSCSSVYDDSYGWEPEGTTSKEDKIKLIQPMYAMWIENIVIPMAELQMTSWEFAIFKGLAIWDMSKSDLSIEGKKLARQYQVSLVAALSNQYKLEEDKILRIGKMILNLSSLQEALKLTIETYFHLEVFNLVEIDDVIKQLLFNQMTKEEAKNE
uniref:Nuclear receptor domain-containing protein n=1 Tax=Rhabditophanes sp. KR3021 TaxID=114890 RepID=A0AC35TQE9_9BILA